MEEVVIMKFYHTISNTNGKCPFLSCEAKAPSGSPGELRGKPVARSGTAAVSLQSYLVFLWHLAKILPLQMVHKVFPEVHLSKQPHLHLEYKAAMDIWWSSVMLEVLSVLPWAVSWAQQVSSSLQWELIWRCSCVQKTSYVVPMFAQWSV